MQPYDSDAGLSVVPFDPVSPQRFPEVNQLLALTRAWLRTVNDDRTAFYSAVEQEERRAWPRGGPGGGGGSTTASCSRRAAAGSSEGQEGHYEPARDRWSSSLRRCLALRSSCRPWALGARQQALEEKVTATKTAHVEGPKPAHRLPFVPPKDQPVPGDPAQTTLARRRRPGGSRLRPQSRDAEVQDHELQDQMGVQGFGPTRGGPHASGEPPDQPGRRQLRRLRHRCGWILEPLLKRNGPAGQAPGRACRAFGCVHVGGGGKAFDACSRPRLRPGCSTT